MPASNKLKRIEERVGESLESLIPRTIEQHGSFYRAAIALDVTPTTLRHWMKTHGYKLETYQSARVVRDCDPCEESHA